MSMDGEPPGTELLIQTPIIYVLISTKNNFKIYMLQRKRKTNVRVFSEYCSPALPKKQITMWNVEPATSNEHMYLGCVASVFIS